MFKKIAKQNGNFIFVLVVVNPLSHKIHQRLNTVSCAYSALSRFSLQIKCNLRGLCNTSYLREGEGEEKKKRRYHRKMEPYLDF